MQRRIVYFLTITILFFGTNLLTVHIASQTKPFTMRQVLNAIASVKEGRITKSKIISDIRQRGVEFSLTRENEKLLRDEGANDEIIEVIRQKQSTVTTNSVSSNSKVNSKTKISVLPLAVQFRLLRVDEAGKETEVDPYSKFTTSDRLRLSLKSNQRGYLYIIRQPAPDADGEIIFPTQLVNNGSNYIAANKDYTLPSNCPKEITPIDCSLTLLSTEDAPQEYFTVIFTRDSLVDLPNDLRNKRVTLQSLANAGKIPVGTIVDLIEESGQDLVIQPGDTPAAMRIINKNVKDNEEIIETFIIEKKKN